MNVSATQQRYTNYHTQTSNSTSKTQLISNFTSAMQEENKSSTNKEVDLLDIDNYQSLNSEDKKEYIKKIGDKYGLPTALAFDTATRFKDTTMQQAVLENIINLSDSEKLNYTTDLNQNINRFEMGLELNPSYNILSFDEDGQPIFNEDLESHHMVSLEASELKDFFTSMKKSETVGEQATYFVNIYDDILNSYINYKEDEKKSYQPYLYKHS